MIRRTIKEQVIYCIKNKPVTLITGARQVGKSTLCFELKEELGFNYVSLDNLRDRADAINDPEYFLQKHKWPIIIDEIQYAPKLFDVIESIVNNEKMINGKNYGMFILTGSQSFDLIKGVSQSMAGRVTILKMSQLSTSEIYGQEENKFEIDINKMNDRVKYFHLSQDELFKLIVRGMYPELYDNKNMLSSKFYSDYVNTYIERDVSQLINIKDKLKFQNFMEVLSSLTGQELVYDSIAKVIGVKVGTIQSWISVLIASEIIYLLQPYNEYSITKSIKRPKMYFTDTGLACYLARLDNVEVLKRSIFSGRFVETYIMNEIRKSYRNNGINENFYYYRDKNQNEIDLVILENGQLHFIECKTGVSFNKSSIKSFKQLSSSNYQIGLSCIICNTPSIYTIDKDIYALPITSI